MPNQQRIPRPTVQRLSLYLRELEALLEAGGSTVSSRQIGRALGLTDAQVRKDLACFGQFGHPGVGYRIADLIQRLREVFGTNRTWSAAVVGAGNVGRAILSYDRLHRKGFDVVAVFDSNPQLTGSLIEGRPVQPLHALPEAVRDRAVKIGIVAVPAEAAQGVAETLIQAGVVGLLNFAPTRLSLDPSFPVVSVDVSTSLEQLAWRITNNTNRSADDQAPAASGT